MEKFALVLTCVTALTIISVTGSKLQMPSFALTGEKVTLECKLDNEQFVIEHVKWYKDNQPFYIVVPANEPSATKLDLPTVPIDMDESKMDKIILYPLTEESSGVYTCELKMDHGMARMSGTLTVHPPKE